VNDFIPQMEPLIAEADAEAVASYVRSGAWLTEFEQTRALERAIAAYTGARFCTITPNGTLAIFLGLSAAGIGPGDEVIVPTLTMAASATAVLLAGAAVRFVDIEADTLCLDLGAAEAAISPRTRAVVVVSLNGRAPAGLAEFVGRCRDRGLVVVEDAAQSLGSLAGDRHLGTLGDCGCFSFSSQKIVTTGQGGAVVTDDEALYHRMLMLRDFGRESGGNDRYLTVGWNLKFTDLQAVIGLEQMRRLPDLVIRRRRIFELYREHLSDRSTVRMPDTDLEQVTPWFVDVLVDDGARDGIMTALRDRGIGTRPFYPALHREPAFAHSDSHPIAESIAERGLWLPSSLKLSDADILRVCTAINDL
jgi:perosamine synthetase